jgi:N-succinyldiaminopimelate aminotransferase
MRRTGSLSTAVGGRGIAAGPNQRQPQYASTAASNANATSIAPAATSLDRHGNTGDASSLAYNPALPTSSFTTLNPQLALLQPYPFERLRALFAGVAPQATKKPISLSLGEPKHPTPQLILDALAAGAKGLANYPTTVGAPALREAIASWLVRRHALAALDPASQVLPVLGSREALFAFAQTVLDASRVGATVVVPNPFYQIYEGAALLAGATTHCVNSVAENAYAPRWDAVPEAVWTRTQLLYVCSPDNPTGRVMTQDDWRLLFELSDRYGFVIAADECYSEIYFDEARPPLGSLGAAKILGRDGFPRLLSFGSLSKRSNAPGLRSGYVAGDAALIKAFLLYRTYHGSAMSPAVAAASIAAWSDEAHVRANRAQYAAKFARLTPRVAAVYPATPPDAAFYLWARVPDNDAEFARRLYAEEAVTVLPGSYLAREADGVNPGRGYVRIALVAEMDECAEAVDRLARFAGRG